jgi:hypothetical protein
LGVAGSILSPVTWFEISDRPVVEEDTCVRHGVVLRVSG